MGRVYVQSVDRNSGDGERFDARLEDLTLPELYELLVQIHRDIERILTRLGVAWVAPDLVDH